MLGHLLGSILGLIFAIFGVFALGTYLATSRAGRLGLVAMVITVLGSALFLPLQAVATFAAPEEGQAVGAGGNDKWGVDGLERASRILRPSGESSVPAEGAITPF